jgi:LPPG:FO 2-phospho-L-lactate transferase
VSVESNVDSVAVLAGGVGAARFLSGLVGLVASNKISAIVNTGDDTNLHGLAISPDLDTIVYTLAGAIDPERGWGLAGETWQALAALERYAGVRPPDSQAGSTWFGLGDRDLATHLYRTSRGAEGATATEVAGEIAGAWGLALHMLPMTDGRFRTMIRLAGGERVSFQDYFVRLRHDVAVEAIEFDAEGCRPTAAVLTALTGSAAVLIAPSNPLVSIGPIRALPGIDELLSARRDSVVAVSPIIGGKALKGPADRMMLELGLEPSVVGVARLYAPIAGTLVIDSVDGELASQVAHEGMRCVVEPTVMSSPDVTQRLAAACLELA